MFLNQLPGQRRADIPVVFRPGQLVGFRDFVFRIGLDKAEPPGVFLQPLRLRSRAEIFRLLACCGKIDSQTELMLAVAGIINIQDR